ncbi:MAG: hypothetical protein KC636_07610 [Myxococcales bacterium]|nr:hypothetical protein [Myxococcales bacterium]
MKTPKTYYSRVPVCAISMALLVFAGCSSSVVDQSGGTDESTDSASSTSGGSGTSTSDASTAGSESGGTFTSGSSDPTGSGSDSDPGTETAATTTEETTGEPVPEDCDTFTQDCPDGYKCTFAAKDGSNTWNDTVCVPVDEDPAGVGEACLAPDGPLGGVDNCELGAMCWDVNPDTTEGYCIALCSGGLDNPICPAMSYCVITDDGILTPCLPTCDPLLGAEACPEEKVCIPSPSGDTLVCASQQGAIGPGDACEFVNVCDDGLVCAGSQYVPGCDLNASGCCTPFCDLLDPDCAAVPGAECVPWFTEAPPGYEDLGVCTTPP